VRELAWIEEKDGLRRRWFSDADWDLIVWLSGPGEIWGFQLCYDRARDERALTWTRETGYSHDRIDDGEGNPTKNRTPVLVPDGVFPALDIVKRFARDAGDIPPAIRDFVIDRICNYPG
jgi:hypothetical protein